MQSSHVHLQGLAVKHMGTTKDMSNAEKKTSFNTALGFATTEHLHYRQPNEKQTYL